MTRRVLCLAATLTAACAHGAAAQSQTATPPPQPETITWKDRLKEPDQAGGLHFTEHWAVVFGGIKRGSGIAAGPAWSTQFGNGGFVQLKAVISIRNFRLLQARYDSPRFWHDRAIVINRVRWHDAPGVKLYQLGPDAPDRHIDYAERRTEASSQIVANLRPAITTSGGFGVERFRTRADRLADLTDPTSLALVVPPPGLGARPLFAHGFATLGYDTRLSPEYTRRGRFIEGQLHGYSDISGSEDSFGRFEGTVEQYVPTHGERGVIGVSVRTWLSLSEGARSVPFYLTPTLGGGNFLRAYNSYRFRDRHALLLKTEYRWAVHSLVDLAGTYEGGKVAPTVDGLGFDNMAHSIAIGVRVHTKKTSLIRADLAYGRDGVGVAIGFSAGS